MKQDFRILFVALTIGIFLVSCSGQKPSTPTISIQPTKIFVPTETAADIPATESPTNTSEPAITQTLTSENVTGTMLNFKFPFEPSFPGYIVEIKSNPLTIDLMCILEPGNSTGDAIELNPNSSETKKYGICDTKSMTLDTRIDDEITVTVILGGHPVVNDVTKSPDRVTDQKVEFDFEYSFE